MDFSVPSGESGFLESIVDSVADPIFVKDRKHRWIFFNEAFAALIGRPREALLGKSDYEFFPKAQADVFFRQDELVFSTGRENANEETLTDADGRTHVLLTKKTRWIAPSGGEYLIGVIRDITEIVGAADDAKRSQERMNRAHKLETLGNLAGGVAHDFNNLLTAISGCAALLLSDLPKENPSRVEAEEIRRAVDRARVLTQRLLSVARRPDALARPVDLRVIVKDMHEMLRRLVPPAMAIDMILPKALGEIRVDPGLVEQVLLNLVVNAGEALPKGGRVTVELSSEPQGGAGVSVPCARLAVRDDGAGMSAKVLARIFEPFFTTKERGSGLGLSTVAETVRRSGGGVEVQSVPGKGTTFHVYWPLVEASRSSRMRALVVDDDDSLRRFAVRCLEREGYEVLAASDAIEALKICGANERLFDVLMLDVVMPGMSGPELAERLRPGQPGASVLFTSGGGRVDCGLPEEAEAGFLAKPFTARELVESLNALRHGVDGPSRRAQRPGPARSRRKVP